MDYIHVVQWREKWRAFVNTGMNLRDSYSVENLLLVEYLLDSKELLCLMEMVYLTNLPVAHSSAAW